MSTLRKIAEAKKQNIRSAAEQQIAEVDKELDTLERLAAKYGLAVVDVPAAEAEPSTPSPDAIALAAAPATANGNLHMTEADALTHIASAVAVLGAGASITKRARAGAKAYIRAKQRPAMLAELDRVLTSCGIRFESESPRSVLSAILGQDDELLSLGRDSGWWLRELGDPPPRGNIVRRI